MIGYPVNLIGNRFDKLVVIGRAGKSSSGTRWACRCDCGGSVERLTCHLRRPGLKGCSACKRKTLSESLTRHGACKTNTEGRSRLWRIWRGMRTRCRTASVGPHWKHYGGKGVRVCAEWQSLERFRTWALSHGYTDSLTIERKNSDGDYCPENCEWITQAENSRRANRRGHALAS